MRCFCLLLTILLLISLASAIGNSMQTSKLLSASHCKQNTSEPGVGTLCPKETMFIYYECCSPGSLTITECCALVKIWLMVALVGVILSFILGICFWLVRYGSALFCRC
ncbi:unnamed protein product [Enterobius vermicularis]|uniref:Uncharacterized protein n=1 Tax=Enterobius vermicularis TaxID=51028 RepID=A0A0N4VR25_ENTVE|nr:unnamed protein product [Enterobius vermicularis]